MKDTKKTAPEPTKEKKKSRRKKHRIISYLPDHLIQGALIFASVFLAFWLNDYRQHLVEKRNSRAAVEIVINEIESNKAILEYWAPKHEAIYKQLVDLAENGLDTVTSFNHWEIAGGPIFSDIITYDGLDFVRQINPRLDLRIRLLINRIYRQQEYVDNAINALTNDLLRQREIFDDSRVKENYVLYILHIGDLYGQEAAMIKEYALALHELNDYIGK